MFSKQSLDMGLSQFFTILEYVCSQTDTCFARVNKDYTSQLCPNCGTHTGKKELNQRDHSFFPVCGYEQDRDVAAAEVVLKRGLTAVGSPVDKQPSNGKGLWAEFSSALYKPRRSVRDYGLDKSLNGNPTVFRRGRFKH